MWEGIPDTTGEGTSPGRGPVDLLVNREGLVGDVMVGGYLGHKDNQIIEGFFNSCRSKDGDQHNIYLDLPAGRLQIF